MTIFHNKDTAGNMMTVIFVIRSFTKWRQTNHTHRTFQKSSIAHKSVCMYACIYICMFVCVCVCMSVSTVYMYTCMYGSNAQRHVYCEQVSMFYSKQVVTLYSIYVNRLLVKVVHLNR